MELPAETPNCNYSMVSFSSNPPGKLYVGSDAWRTKSRKGLMREYTPCMSHSIFDVFLTSILISPPERSTC